MAMMTELRQHRHNWQLSLILAANAASLSLSYFVQTPSTHQSHKHLKLAAADSIGASYQGIAHNSSTASLPNFALSLDADFGSLERQTFNKLKDAYSGWSETPSAVIWKENERYTLLDFLPPFMQAVSGLHFHTTRSLLGMPSFVGSSTAKKKTEHDSFNVVEQEVLVAYNCWGFAWEVMRAATIPNIHSLTVSTADPSLAWEAFTSSTDFELIQSSQSNPELLACVEKRNENISAGDVVLVWHQNDGQPLFLDHVAIVLDDDLYYEKSGSGDHVPFRVNTWDGLAADFPPAVFHWDWRRLVRHSSSDDEKDEEERKGEHDQSDKKCNDGSGKTEQKKNRRPDPLSSAEDAFGLQKFADIEQFEPLSHLRLDVARNFSMTPQYSDDGTIVEAQTYTAIIQLKDNIEFDEVGRASLPDSAFLVHSLQPALPPDIFNNDPFAASEAKG